MCFRAPMGLMFSGNLLLVLSSEHETRDICETQADFHMHVIILC